MKKQSKIQKNRRKSKLTLKQLNELRSKQIGLNQILKPIIFFVVSLILEILSFVLFKFKTSSGSAQILPKYLLFDFGFWILIGSLMLCTSKNWISNIIYYLAILFEVILLVANTTLRNGFGYLFTFDMFDLLYEMTASIDSSFLDFKLIIFAVLGASVMIAIPLIVDKFCKNKKITIKKVSKPIFCLLCFLVTATVGMGSYSAQLALLKTSKAQKEISDDKYLYQNQQVVDQAYQKFGSCGFYLKNLINTLFPNNGISKEEKSKILEQYNSSLKAASNTDFKGDNLIVIMMESVEWFAIDPYTTPNLWALKTGEPSDNISKQAMVFNNYFSNNKTNVSENLCMLGYMPSVCNFNTSTNNLYSTKYSLPNLLKNEGYTTSFFHNWDANFYTRKTTNKHIGFDNIYTIDDYESPTKSTKFNYYNLESDFAEQFMSKIAPTDGKPFMSFYTTVSSHGLYNVTNPLFEKYSATYDNNLEKIKEWLASKNYHYPTDTSMQAIFKHYKSAVMDTDEMIGKLFKHLRDNSLLDNTTVVIYSDHYSFYHNLSNEIKSTNKTDYASQVSYVVPMMIYSEKLAGSNVDTFCSPYDLYPTLCEMYGLPYNLINAQGKNMLSSEISETVYFSHLTGFYSGTCYSKNMLYIQKYTNSTDNDANLFKDNVCKLLEKQRLLNIIYRSNITYQ